MKIEELGSQTTTDSQTAISRCVRLTRGGFSCSESHAFSRTKDSLKVVTVPSETRAKKKRKEKEGRMKED